MDKIHSTNYMRRRPEDYGIHAEIDAVFEHKSKWIMQCKRSGRSAVYGGVAARRDLVNLRHEKEGGATGHASKANAT